MISHCPEGDLVLSYSAGALGEGWSLAVASHLAYCSTCRSVAEYADEVGGVLLDDQTPSHMPLGSFDSLLEKAQSRDYPRTALAIEVRAEAETTIPQPLQNYVGTDMKSIPWSPIGAGAYQYLIHTPDDSQARLLKIAAGGSVPEHTHEGRELTLVISGSFSDESGYFGPGDLEDLDETTTHRPVAGEKEACICLAVTDAPLRFTGVLPRLFQSFIGI